MATDLRTPNGLAWSPDGRKAVRKFRELLADVKDVRAQHQRDRRG